MSRLFQRAVATLILGLVGGFACGVPLLMGKSKIVIPPGFPLPNDSLQLAISSRGLGRRPLTAETRVRIPVSLPTLPK